MKPFPFPRGTRLRYLSLAGVLAGLLSCGQPGNEPDVRVQSLQLKQGPLVSCGPEQQFGTVAFDITAPASLKEDFRLGLKLLHSFEYDEAEKVFAGILQRQPDVPMAYWGVAMANFHPLWAPPSGPELRKGAAALRAARSLRPTGREAAYLGAIGAFYDGADSVPHRARCIRFSQAMEAVHRADPGDREAAALYALSLVAAADPKDKTYRNQLQAGTLLSGLYPGAPDHPGVVHYLIHAYDYPGLAERGLPAARRYAAVAPSSAHALHMPSHIFTRLGLWDECVRSNLESVSSAQCYAKAAGMEGHWDEEVHGLDYLVYAYLQQGNRAAAGLQRD